jgi:hypothetical protein
MGALGEVGMLAGSLPQRRKEKQRQAEEMKILQTGDPQQIINYSLTEAARLNDPQLLAAAQQAQKRLETQGVAQQMQSLANTLANPTAKAKDGTLLGDNPGAVNSIAEEIRQLNTTNQNLPSDYAQQLIDQARSDRSTNLSNRAKAFIGANPDLTSDSAREAFIGEHGDSAGAEFDVVASTLKTNQRAVQEVDLNILKDKVQPQIDNIEVELRQEIGSANPDQTKIKSLQQQHFSLTQQIKGDVGRSSGLVRTIASQISEENSAIIEAGIKTQERDFKLLSDQVMANVFAKGATGDADVRFDGELKRIRALLPSITMEQETRLRERFKARMDAIDASRKAEASGTLSLEDEKFFDDNPSLFAGDPEFQRAYDEFTRLSSKKPGTQSIGDVSRSKALAQLLTGKIVTARTNQRTEILSDENIELQSANAVSAVIQDLPSNPRIISVDEDGERPFNTRIFRDPGRNRYQVIADLQNAKAEGGDDNKLKIQQYDNLLKQIAQHYKENPVDIQNESLEKRTEIVFNALDELSIYDADDMQAIADTGRAQAQLDADYASFDQAIFGEAYERAMFQFMGLPPERLYKEAMKMMQDPQLVGEFARTVQDKEVASRGLELERYIEENYFKNFNRNYAGF